MEDLSKLPDDVAVELMPPAAGSADLSPMFVVTQPNSQEGLSDMLLSLGGTSDSCSDEADAEVDSDDDDYHDSAGNLISCSHFQSDTMHYAITTTPYCFS